MPKPPTRIEIDFAGIAGAILRDYHDLLLGAARLDEDGAVKALSARHAAGKVVLSHLEMLVKLANAQADAARRVEPGETLAGFRSLMPPLVTEDPLSDDAGDAG